MLTRSLRMARRLRRRTGALVIDGFFRGVSNAGKLHPNARPERHKVEVLRDVEYLDSGLAEHRLDIYRPTQTNGERLPVVLYVHGGGFRILSKETHWIMGLAFARRGYLVFNISYRLAPRHPYPAAIMDACAALEWVHRHANEYGGDPNRIALAGESAGANLVTALAVATSYERPEPWAKRLFDAGISPRAVLPACGVLEVGNPERFRRRWPNLGRFIEDRIQEVSHGYLRGTESHAREALELANPLLVLEKAELPARPLPPFFAVCGTKDPLIWDTQRLKLALDRLRTECQVSYYPGELHAFHALVWRPNARDCWKETYRFLGRHLSLESDASGAVPSE